MTRALTIAAVVIVLLGLAVGGYFWWEAKQQASLTVGETPVTNPFGSNGTDVQTTDTSTDTATDSTSGTAVQVAPKLVQIAKGSAAAGISVSRIVIPPPPGSASTTASTTDTEVRYVDRASGNIFAYDIHQAKSSRLSNRTIPGAAQASWLADGSVAFLRFITVDASQNQSVNTYALPASGVGGYALSPGLAQVIAVGSSSVLTLSSTNTGSTAIFASATGANPRTLLSTALTQIKIFWTTAGVVSETLPSASTVGYAFTTDKNGNQVLVAGPLTGLSVLPNRAGTKAIISYVSGKTLKLAQLDFATRTLIPLPVATLAEKCVWSPDDHSAYCGVPVSLPSGTLPDDWYQGAVQFSDRIWRINFDSRVAELIANLPALANASIDATSLTMDSAGDVLGFENKTDNSVWSYDL